MISQSKKDLLEKYYTNKVGLKHLWLFFSFFLVLGLLALNIAIIYGLTLVPSQSQSDLDKYKKLFPYFPIMLAILLTLLTLSTFWWVNSLAHILFVRYYHHNIFKAEKWLKVKLFTTLNIAAYKTLNKNLNMLSNKDKKFLFEMQEAELIPQGDYALALAYKDYYYKPNKIEFIAINENFNPKAIANSNNLEISSMNEVFIKAKYQDIDIEISRPRFIPLAYQKNKSKMILPNKNYLLALKLQQLLQIYQSKQAGKKVAEANIETNLSNIAFILAKEKNLCFKTIIKDFKNASIDHYFVNYFLKTFIFEDFEKLNDFQTMLNKFIDKSKNFNELKWFFEQFFLTIKNDKELSQLHHLMNKIIANKVEIDNKYLKNLSSKNKKRNGFKLQFTNLQEKQTYLAQFPNQFKSQLIANYYANFNNEQQNTIDMRAILLLELNKQLGVTNEK
ncbi:MAG4530 family protein [Metamycoplasma alkalescens]|uniref:Uncharacterized protein n=2 Tax=Metamycoplasma alkalescens TaxID=45363 RepID=A0A318U8Q7_9BACT|nr:hypothetical protein [Metamycoplasma alkalescens]PYF42228.1 hypothetical protein BCF88_1134 [Metamycoplasma alkalescens]